MKFWNIFLHLVHLVIRKKLPFLAFIRIIFELKEFWDHHRNLTLFSNKYEA